MELVTSLANAYLLPNRNVTFEISEQKQKQHPNHYIGIERQPMAARQPILPLREPGGSLQDVPQIQHASSSQNQGQHSVRRRVGRKVSGSSTSAHVDQRHIDHANRKQELWSILNGAMLPNASQAGILLLCSGNKYRCDVNPVQINDTADSAAIWRNIRRAWEDNQRCWWRYTSKLRKIKSITIVKVG